MPSTYPPIGSINTIDKLSNANGGTGNLTPQQIWDKAVQIYEENTDFWQSYEGKSESSVILTNTDLAKGDGSEMYIRTESGYYDEPHYGDDTFDTDDDFEEDKYSEYKLVIDVIRHATSGSERAIEKLGGMRGLYGRQAKKLGSWMGRIKSENLDMMFCHKVNSANVVRPSGKALASLTKTDTLSMNFVSTAAGILGRLGGQRARTGMINGAPCMGLTLIAASDALTILRQDSAYQTLLSRASERGKVNSLWKGEVTDLDGISVVRRDIIDHDGEGAIGNPMTPRALLGNAISPGTAVFDVTGGGNSTSAAKTKKLYFKYFSGHAYKFSDGDTLSQGSATRYLLIQNPPNAVTDPGKFGMYSYTTGNNGNKITILQRLGSAASGDRVTTLGGVTWNTGAWANLHTATHPEGSLVVECNANGIPIARSFILGAQAALRGYGMYRNRRGQEKTEDEFFTKTFIRSYFGQKIRQDRLGRQPGIVVLEHAHPVADMGIPG
jgi:hypothetical protein